MKKETKLQLLILFLLLVLALGVRLYKINIPLADNHSWRQADTAAVARNFIKEGFNFLRPRIDNMAPLHPNVPNKERYFLVEPPVYQTIVAAIYKVWGVKEPLARLVSVLFSLGTMILVYLLLKHFLNGWVGLLAAFFLAVLPYNIFYSRVILPEPMAVFVSTGMLYFFALWLEKDESWWRWFLAVFFTIWSLLIKTFPLFLVLPMFYLVWQKYQFSFLKQKKLWLFVPLVVLPLILWRKWISQFPEGIPAYLWLFNQGGIRFRPAFFRWIFAERIGKLILGYWGLPLLVAGLIVKPGKKAGWFFHLWLVSFLVYVTVFAAGNVTHDYYQIPFIPLAAIFLAKGVYWLLTEKKADLSRLMSWLMIGISILFMLGFSWFEVKEFYNIQGGVDLAGRAVDELTSKNALVLTGDSNDVTLLYNTNRYGWTGGYASNYPNTPGVLEEVRKMGATVYVATKFDKNSEFGKYLLVNYPVLQRTNQYIIFLLINKNKQ